MIKFINKFFVSLSIMFLAAGSAYSLDLPASMKQTMANETAGMPSLLNLVVSMIVVIGLIYVTGWIYNKLNIINRDKLNRLGARDIEAHKFKVLQSMPLGQHRHIYSIEMNGKVLLVGSTPSHISLIKEFDKENNAKLNSQEIVSGKNEGQSFTETDDSSAASSDIEELFRKYKN